MSVSGNLEDMHLADLLQWCAANVKTGRLRLKRDPIEKSFFFKEGCLFSSTSNSPRETLVQFLIRSGYVTEEELLRAFNAQVRLNLQLGEVLTRLGLIGEEELTSLFRLKTEESIYDCFLWPDGDFAFLDGKLPEIAVPTPCDITRLVFEGARRKDEWGRIQNVFRSRYSTFWVEDTNVAATMDLSETDREILHLLTQKKSLVDIAFETGQLEFHVASRMLDLYEMGLISIDEIPNGISYEQQVETLQEFVREGVALYNATRYDEARAAFEKALKIDPHHKYARLIMEKLDNAIKYRKPVKQISFDSIPVLRMSTEELTSRALDAQEGFVLSRINGEWDLGSIVKLCPIDEQEVLFIVRRLLDDDVIELKNRASSAQPPDTDFSWDVGLRPNPDI
jgi:tetratricopeptide (TPR) repeat protein